MTAKMSSTATTQRKADPYSTREHWHRLDLQTTHAAEFGRAKFQHDLLLEASMKVKAEPQEHYDQSWAYRARQNGYDQTAAIIALSNYWKSDDFVRCGYRDSLDGRQFSCGDTLLCPRCAAIKLKWQTLDEFSPGFYSAGWHCYLVTLSVNREPDHLKRLQFIDQTLSQSQQIKTGVFAKPDCFDTNGLPFDTVDDLATCHCYFDIFSRTMREVTAGKRKHLFRGSICVPELAVSFIPRLQVRPHIHAPVWADDFSADDARELRRLVTRQIHDCRLLRRNKHAVHSSVDIRRLAARADFERAVRYVTKPIDLAGAYLTAAESVNLEAGAMAKLNGETNLFLFRLPVLFRGMRRVQRYGVCHARNKAYIGVVTPWRARRRVQAAASRTRREEDRVTLGWSVNPRRKPTKDAAGRLNDFWVRWEDEPHRFPSRKFEYWRRFVSTQSAHPASSQGSQFVLRTPMGTNDRASSTTSTHELN